MNLLAERLKNIDDPGRFYKRSTENKPFFIKNQLFTVQKRVNASKDSYYYGLPKKDEDSIINNIFISQELLSLRGKLSWKNIFLDLKKFSIQNNFWYKKKFQHKKNLNAKKVWTLKKSELAKNWSIIYIFLDGIEFDNEKIYPKLWKGRWNKRDLFFPRKEILHN